MTSMRSRCDDIVNSGNLIDPIQAATNVDLMAQIDELCKTPTSFTINNNSYIQVGHKTTHLLNPRVIKGSYNQCLNLCACWCVCMRAFVRMSVM